MMFHIKSYELKVFVLCLAISQQNIIFLSFIVFAKIGPKVCPNLPIFASEFSANLKTFSFAIIMRFKNFDLK